MIELLGFSIPLVWFHLAALFATIGVILRADHEGFAYIRGSKQVLQRQRIDRLHRLMWVGLLLLAITGFVMFWPLREYLLTHPPFQIKMFFVIVLFVNGLFIGRLSRISYEQPFAELTDKHRLPLFISGAVSLLAWSGAIIAALLMEI